jgi:predicted transcriptional regulator
MSIPQGIKKIKYLLDINQKQLAEILNVSPSLITYYEKGKKVPSQLTLKKLIDLIKERNIDMSIEEFLL